MIHTCDKREPYESDPTGMCADYWKVHDALASREICCDRGSPKESRPPQTAPRSEPKHANCSEAMKDKIAQAVSDAIDALEFSGCMERHVESFTTWRDRLRKNRFVCWDAITNQDDPPCAKAGRPHETPTKFSRKHITIFSRNFDSCGCLHANLIHELSHTFGYGHEGPRNAYEIEADCAACGK